MAKMKSQIDITTLLQQAMIGVRNDIQLAMHREFAQKIGQVAAVTIQAQMRAKGIRRAKATGTHLKRSKKEQAAANRYGSMLDISYKVWRSQDMNMDIVFAGQTLSAYKARFRDDGWKNHHYWGNPSGNDYGKEDYIDSAKSILRREVPSLVRSVARRVLANPKRYKQKHGISIN
jgi:hypothetical protein